MVAMTSAVKPGGVSATMKSYVAARHDEDVSEQLDGDRARLIGPRRREQDLDPRVVRHHVVVELVLVEGAARDGEVVHRLLRGQAHAEPDVAELQVEVDDEHLLAGEGERDREVARGQGLARAALRAEHADEAPFALRPPPCAEPRLGARVIALLIANRSCSFDCGNSAMSAAPASNARRRNPFGDEVERTTIGGRALSGALRR